MTCLYLGLCLLFVCNLITAMDSGSSLFETFPWEESQLEPAPAQPSLQEPPRAEAPALQQPQALVTAAIQALPTKEGQPTPASQSKHPDKDSYACSFPHCKKTFTDKYNCKRHFKTHKKKSHLCKICQLKFTTALEIASHRKTLIHKKHLAEQKPLAEALSAPCNVSHPDHKRAFTPQDDQLARSHTKRKKTTNTTAAPQAYLPVQPECAVQLEQASVEFTAQPPQELVAPIFQSPLPDPAPAAMQAPQAIGITPPQYLYYPDLIAAVQAWQATVILPQPPATCAKPLKIEAPVQPSPQSGSAISCEKKYICALGCGQTFNHLNECREHEWAVHLPQDPSRPHRAPRSYRPPRDKSSLVSQQTKCFECNITYEYRSSLLRHVQNHHRGDRVYKCITCQKTFSTKSDFKNHRATACTP